MKELKYLIIILLLFLVSLAAPGLIQEKLKEEKSNVGIMNSCPIINSTYSFCFLKDGKYYYFSILGWVDPNATIVEQYVKGGIDECFLESECEYLLSRPTLFLAIKSNLEWKWYGSNGEVLVGELYKEALSGYIGSAIQINNDTFLVPYTFADFWESYSSVINYYIPQNNIRLYFQGYNFLGLNESQLVRVGEVVLTEDEYDDKVLDMYINYPSPKFNLSIIDVRYLERDDYGHYYFNATLLINNASIIAYYKFNETGQKYEIDTYYIPIYMLTNMTYSNRDIWVIRKINETHYLIALPVDVGFDGDNVEFGLGFKDVWLEPQHEYLASYVFSGEVFCLEIEVSQEDVTGNTLIFTTPWSEYMVYLSS